MNQYQVAVLDDYQGVARDMADWTSLESACDIQIFRDHIADEQALIERLKPFHVVCLMRERTPMPWSVLAALPNLRLLISTGKRNPSIDQQAAQELGIALRFTDGSGNGAMEHTWALILSAMRNIVPEAQAVRQGAWQTAIGTDLIGSTIGIIGLGRIGSGMAKVANAFGMRVLAWSQNLTAERAAEHNAQLVSKAELLRESHIVTLHLPLSERSRGILGADDLALMRPDAWLINTARGPLVDEAALIQVLRERKIAGAALDVYDIEPLPADHPFRTLDNVLATGHIGFVTRASYKVFYQQTVQHITDWLASA